MLAVVLAVLLRRDYESPSLLERRLLGTIAVGATIYWFPVVPFVVFTPDVLRVAIIIGVITVVVAFVVDLVAGPSGATSSP
jgi:hypothetical protein